MECHVSPDYREVSKEHFMELLSNLDWERDAFCGGEYYYVANMPRRPRIGTRHRDGKQWRYWVDPKFFSPEP